MSYNNGIAILGLMILVYCDTNAMIEVLGYYKWDTRGIRNTGIPILGFIYCNLVYNRPSYLCLPSTHKSHKVFAAVSL